MNKTYVRSAWYFSIASLLCILSSTQIINAQISRTQIINNALPYTLFSWTAYPSNCLSGGYYCSGVGRTVFSPTPANSTQRGWVAIGTNISMPYAWGGWATQAEHISHITNGSTTQAGDICGSGIIGGGCANLTGATPPGCSCWCSSGHDCSGLVSRAWQLSNRANTITLPNFSTSISLSSTQPGDILNKSGSHTRLVKTNNGNGNYLMIEASGTDWKVAEHNYTPNDLTGYDPRCPNSSIVIGGCSTSTLLCNNDYSCGPPSPKPLAINSACINSNCSTVGASPPTNSINYYGGSACTTLYQATRYDDDVWFIITPNNINPVTINVTPTSNTNNFDPVVGIYSGSCSAPSEIACADINSVGGSEQVTFSPTVGTNYLIRVFSYGMSSTNSGNFDICATTSIPACNDNYESNDNCGSATPVFGSPLGIGTANYTPQGTNIGYAGDQDWFTFQLAACGTFNISLSNLPYDYDIELYGVGCLGQFIGSSYNGGTTDEQIFFTSTTSALTTYYVKVYPYVPSSYSTTSCYNLNFQWASTASISTPVIIPSGTISVCSGVPTIFSVQSPESGVLYYWSDGGTGINHTVSNYNGSIYCWGNNSCGNSGNSNTVFINLSTVPSQPGNISGNTTVCQSSSQFYSISPVLGATSYIWSLPGGWSGSSSTTSINTIIGSSSGNITVIASNNCGNSSSQVLNVISNSLPVTSISASGSTSFCTGGVTLNAPVAANRSYQWKKNGVSISGATASSYVATTSGTYKVNVTNTITGCSKTTSTGTSVTKFPSPSATINPSGPTTFCVGGSVLITANSGTGLSYQWKKNGINLSGATAFSYVATTSGTYKVIVTNSNNCSKVSSGIVVTVNCRANGSQTLIDNFDVFPNPSNGFVSLKLDSKEPQEIQIVFSEMTGKEVLRIHKSLDIGNNEELFDLHTLAKGNYIITVEWPNGILQHQKIVLQ